MILCCVIITVSKAFMQAFIDWTYSYIALVDEHVAIDGKAVRAAAEKIEGKCAPYIVNSLYAIRSLCWDSY